VYTVDTRSGMLASTDPKTLTPHGSPQPLAAGLEPDGVAIDGRGQPWAADHDTGELVWLSGGQRRTHPAALSDTSHLTVTQDQPALVDPARGTADLLDPDTGAVTRSAQPDLRPGDTVAVSGSPGRPRLLVSVASRGAFIACTFDTATCTTPLTIGSPGNDLGAPVEVDNHAVVPDYTTGQAAIIDLTTMRLLAQRQLFNHPVRFELLVQDGIIFFNDPTSNHAGVLNLTGELRLITKYDHTNPDNGTTPTPGTSTQSGQPPRPDRQASNPGPDSTPTKPGPRLSGPSSATPGPRSPDSPGPPSPDPVMSIVVTPRNSGLVGEEFEFTLLSRPATGITDARWRFGDGTDATGTTVHHRWDRAGTFHVTAAATLSTGREAPIAETTMVIDPPGTPPRIEHLNIDRPNPVIGQTVHFSANTTGSQPEQWHWTITNPNHPETPTTATTPTFQHAFTTPGIHTINLTITAGTHTASTSQNLTVASGRVLAWGFNSSEQTSVPAQAASGVIAIATGGSVHSLALRADGSVIGWGENSSGQVSVPPQATHDVIAITAGSSHSLALKSDGSVIAWGANFAGQASVPPQAASDVIAIAAGASHSLALKSDGSVIGWGDNFAGQVTVPPQATHDVTAVDGGETFSLALKADGSVIAWGADHTGRPMSVPPQAAHDVIAISAGADHSLALKSDGSVIGWGDNFSGQVSVPPEATHDVIAISAGPGHSVALKADGSVIRWGDDPAEVLTVPPQATHDVIAISAGGTHILALSAV
jgi:hypothetical protein